MAKISLRKTILNKKNRQTIPFEKSAATTKRTKVERFTQALQQEKIPRVPTVKELLLFHTGAPEFVVMKGELNALDGRYCTIINQSNVQTSKFHHPITKIRLQITRK